MSEFDPEDEASETPLEDFEGEANSSKLGQGELNSGATESGNSAVLSFDHAATKVKEFPQGPGVYLMKDIASRVIYVGKAKNLRSRAGSYFLKAAQELSLIHISEPTRPY